MTQRDEEVVPSRVPPPDRTEFDEAKLRFARVVGERLADLWMRTVGESDCVESDADSEPQPPVVQ